MNAVQTVWKIGTLGRSNSRNRRVDIQFEAKDTAGSSKGTCFFGCLEYNSHTL